MNEINLGDLEGLLDPLDDEAKNTVMLAVSDIWRVPPMTRETIIGNEPMGGFLNRWPSIVNEESGYLDFDKVDQMMATGQVAYPMMLKKAPVISIVRSASGFTIKSADEEFAKVAHANLQEILPKRIDEILTYLEYGAYYGEVTYDPTYPQAYGLPKSDMPYWTIEDFNGIHPNTITEILRDEESKAFQGFIQQPMGFYEPIEVGTERALIIPNNGMFGNLGGTSVLEPVYVWWFWYELVWRAFLRFLQRAGVGVVVVKAPSRGRVEIQGKSIDNMQWALQMASSLHRTNYAAVPSDMDRDSGHPLWVIDYLKMGQNEGNQFIDALEMLSSNIKNYLLTGDSGPAGEGAEFEVMLDTERILGHIGMYVSEYVLPKMLYWNGSETTKATLEFQGANSRILPLLFKLMAVAGNTAGDALQNVNWRMLFSKGGVPVLTEEEVEELKEEKEEAVQKQQEMMQKAKAPPGGEGRWTSERDKEGKAEKLMREALDVPVIALGPEQVAELERLGLRVQEDPIVLYNPYHDELGRFTGKHGAVLITQMAGFEEWRERYNKNLEDYDFWHTDRESVGDTIDVNVPSRSFFKKGNEKEDARIVFDKLGPKLKAVGKFRIGIEIWYGRYWDDKNDEFYDELERLVARSDYPDIVEYMHKDEKGRWRATKEASKWEGDLDSIRLYNPYHDSYGQFTSKEQAVSSVAAHGALVGAGAVIAGGLITGISEYIRKKKNKRMDSTAISAEFKGRKWSVTYNQIEVFGADIATFGLIGFGAGLATSIAAGFVGEIRWQEYKGKKKQWWDENKEDFFKSEDNFHGWWKNNQSSWNYQKPSKSAWPTGATQDQFQDMYHSLAKAFHPDIAGKDKTDIMQEINAAYDRKDWAKIQEMFSTRLEYMPGEDKFFALLVFEVMMEAVRDGAEFVSFEVEKDHPIFPTVNGKAYIDANMVENIYTILSFAVESGVELEGDHFDPFWQSYPDGGKLLFNPYHDPAGRFTEKQRAVKPLSEDKLHTHGEIDRRAAFRTADAASLAYERMKQKPKDIHMYADMKEYVKQACGKSRTKSACITKANNSYSFYANGSIHVGPRGIEAILADRSFGERIISHEAYHSRKRRGGKFGPTFRTGEKYIYDNYAKRDIEEATTDMLSMRDAGGNPIYLGQMGAMSIMLGQVSGWDKDKAWKLADDLHYNINNWDYIGKLATDFVGGTPEGGWSGAMIYALLAELQKSSAKNNHQALNWMFQGER